MSLRSTLPKVRRPLSSRFTYFVATGLGISFSLTLVFLAWQNAHEDETKQFKVESASLREAVTHSITASDDLTHTLATQMEVMGEIRGELFQVFASAILSRYPFIESISYHPLIRKLPSMGLAGHDLMTSVEVERLFRSSELVKYRGSLIFPVETRPFHTIG